MNAIELSAEPDNTRRTISDTSGIVPLRHHRKKDGMVFPVEITFNDFVYLGRPMRIAAVRDITEHIQAGEALKQANEMLALNAAERAAVLDAHEKTYKEFIARTRRDNAVALRESEEKYSALFEKAAVPAVLTKMPSGVFVEVNEAFETVFGYTRQEILGKTFVEVGMVQPEEYARAYADLERRGIVHGSEKHFRTKSGETRECLINMNKVQIRGEEFFIATIHDITKRKQMEEELSAHREHLEELVQERTAELNRINTVLQTSQAILQSFYDSVPFMMGIAELDGNKSVAISVNRATVNFLAIPIEDLPGKTGIELGNPEDFERLFVENYRRCQREGAPVCFEYAYPHPSGQRWLEVNVAFIGIGTSGSPQFSFVAEDVTERKRAESQRAAALEELRKSEQRFAALFHKSAFGIALSRISDNVIIDVNPEVEKELGYTREEMIGKTAVELGINSDPEIRDRIHAELKKYGFIHDFDMRVVKKDGSRAFILVNIDYIEIGGEKYSLWTARDITERKRTEEALLESEEKYRRIVETAQEGIWVVDAARKTSYVNAHMAEMLGYTIAELVEHSLFEFMDEDACKEAEQLLERRRQGISERHEFRFRRKNGADLYAIVSTNPIMNADGEFIGALGMLTDVTERKQMEQKLRETNQLLETILESTHVLVAYMDTHFNFIKVNRAYAEADQREPSFFTGKNHFELYPNAENETIFHDTVNTGKPSFTYAKPFEYAEALERGVTYWDWSLIPIKDENDVVTSLLLTLANVTERKKVELDLLQANKALMTLHEMLREQAARDALTGLHNRRYLYETVERELARAKREDYPISVVMIDIDHFKKFNDTHGHQAGDEILIALGKLLQNSVRQGDVDCRYGGEEFILIMPNAQMEDALRRAEAICRDFQNLQIEFNGSFLSATVSVGVALYPDHGGNANHVIKAADLALYQAKSDGRNCVRVAGTIAPD